jgi:hypothetical protein
MAASEWQFPSGGPFPKRSNGLANPVACNGQAASAQNCEAVSQQTSAYCA